jgi:hypothetical protein
MRHVAGRLSFPELYQTNEAFELLNKGAHLLCIEHNLCQGDARATAPQGRNITTKGHRAVGGPMVT